MYTLPKITSGTRAYPKHVVFVTLKDCKRDISDHLKFCKISGAYTCCLLEQVRL